jgi:hypothetical protein
MYANSNVGLISISHHSARLKTRASRTMNKMFAMTNFIDLRMIVHLVRRTTKRMKS